MMGVNIRGVSCTVIKREGENEREEKKVRKREKGNKRERK